MGGQPWYDSSPQEQFNYFSSSQPSARALQEAAEAEDRGQDSVQNSSDAGTNSSSSNQMSVIYDGSKSTWYSSSLYTDDDNKNTSYDYTYLNSYSYDTNAELVYQWDYAYDDWNTTNSYYTGRESNWDSASLYSDGDNVTTSYDYTYRNSYSYASNDGKVHQWDYARDAWSNGTDSDLAGDDTAPDSSYSGNTSSSQDFYNSYYGDYYNANLKSYYDAYYDNYYPETQSGSGFKKTGAAKVVSGMVVLGLAAVTGAM